MVKKKDKGKKKEASNAGRKPLWDLLDIPSKLDSIKGWCMNGSTDEDIMKMLGVGKDVFYRWKREKEEFKEAVKRGKEVANGELLNSAFRQASGYTYTEQVPIKVKEVVYNAAGKKVSEIEKVIVTEVQREAPPNPTMNIFMLKNRLPEQYKDKQEVSHTVTTKLEDIL